MKMRSLFILYPDKKYIQCYNDEIEAEQYHPYNLEIEISISQILL